MNPAKSLLGVVAGLSLAACTVMPNAPQAFAIGGHIVTPEGVQRDSWIVIENGRIASIQKEKPSVATTLATSDYVFPGFVDLHNHPDYNVLPRWRPPHSYVNRYEWRGDPIYRAMVKPHAAAIATPDSFCDVDAYVELRMLMAGTTTTIGISKPRNMPSMDCLEGLARNLDWHTGLQRQQPIVNLVGITEADMRGVDPKALAEKLKTGDVQLLAIHIAEGAKADPKTKSEFALLERSGLLTGRTAIIHGIALAEPEFEKMGAVRASLIWSPRSNMVLYGETADVLAARKKVRVALAPDWSPTGSDSLLDEIAFAASFARERLGGAIKNQELFEMATKTPAEIAGVADQVGSLAPNLRADLFVLKSAHLDAYAALTQTGASDIGLVLVDGMPVYGDAAYMKALNVPATEAVTVCGAPKAINSQSLRRGPLSALVQRLGALLSASGSSLNPMVELCR
jgi:cytosine/adenosine deaminase-related metal-dependent hydrolase